MPPTIFLPQRQPYNPGGYEWGPTPEASDFEVWTFIYDASGVASATLKWRVDADGANPLSSIQNETYAGGPEVGAWQNLPMAFRDFPAGNFLNDPSIDFFEMPAYIADEYYVQVTGLRSVLICLLARESSRTGTFQSVKAVTG